MKRAALIALGAMATVSWLGGCATSPKIKVVSPHEWTTPMSNLDLVPMARFSEDVRVGDVLVISDIPQRSSLSGSRWTMLPVSDLLVDEYGARAGWPSTPPEYLLVEEDESSDAEPDIVGDPEIFSARKPTVRLPILDLAMLSNTVISTGDHMRLVPLEVVSVLPGVAWDDPKLVRVSIAAAESYSLSLESLLPLAIDPPVGEYLPRFRTDDQRAAMLGLLGGAEETVELALISEVVYVRAVDIVVQLASSPRQENPLYEEELEVAEDEDEAAAGTESDESDEMAIDPILAAYARAQAINSILIEGDLGDTPVGTLRVINATEDSITIRRILRHGVAIAVRGMQLSVDPSTMEIKAIEPLR